MARWCVGLIALVAFRAHADNASDASNTADGVYCSDNKTSEYYCNHRKSCQWDYNSMSELPKEKTWQDCQDWYYQPRCNQTKIDDFNPECLPFALSECETGTDVSKCTSQTLNMWFFTQMCGLDVLKIKYGPDKKLVDRRMVYSRLFMIILENLAAFVFPLMITITACLIFHAKSKERADGSQKMLGCIPKKAANNLINYASALVAIAGICLAAWTSACTMYAFWAQVHAYHKSLNFGSKCNFALMMEFIAYQHAFEVMALASFCLFDLVLILTITVWTIILFCGGFCTVQCCNIRAVLCCKLCQYFSCHCYCCVLATTLCTCCASIVFAIALIPLLIYAGAVTIAVLIMYVLFLAVLMLVFFVCLLVLRNLLAALTCGTVIMFATPQELVGEAIETVSYEFERVSTCQPTNKEKEEEKPPVVRTVGVIQRFASYSLFTALIPLVLLIITSFLFPIADNVIRMFAINFADISWVYDRQQDPMLAWQVLFKYQWMDIAAGITDFAKAAFYEWPGTVFADVKALITTGSSESVKGAADGWDMTQMWYSNGDWTDYKTAILVARAWSSAFEGVIVAGLAIKYALLDRSTQRDLDIENEWQMEDASEYDYDDDDE